MSWRSAVAEGTVYVNVLWNRIHGILISVCHVLLDFRVVLLDVVFEMHRFLLRGVVFYCRNVGTFVGVSCCNGDKISCAFCNGSKFQQLSLSLAFLRVVGKLLPEM